ncbi:MAG: 4Fe-4S binding protein [Deltaproteobacteria bacterium]|nr:4Fe-4S binding protein [Deltaproteobacteria bacterium]
MPYDTVKLIYFSPTRTTQKILQAMARGMPVARIDQLDLTPPQAETQSFAELGEELTILGAPVYAGRLPIEAVRRLRRLKSREAPAIVVVVYGNRAYEDALLELKDLAVEQGFRPLAAGAFIGEHSYSTGNRPIAHGRPDEADLNQAREFGQRVFQKLTRVRKWDRMPVLEVPGNFPYKERMKRPPEAPSTQEGLCLLCGTCATVCPAAAVVVEEAVITEPERCLVCQACVKSCPTGARVMEVERINKVAEWLNTHCALRKEPELFL